MKLSICMMIKNEEKNLKRCLDSLKDLRNSLSSELIIVDTGSTDNSVEIAKEYTEKVYFHKWNDDFSGMRNKTIECASGEWVFIIDADEELKSHKPIVEIFTKEIKKEVGAIAITVENVTGYSEKHIMSKSPRFFRKNEAFHYEGIVHNMPKFIGDIYEIKTTLMHYGYINTDEELMEKKFNRTKTLLEKALEEDPDNIYYRYQLGVSYMMHKDFYEGCNEFSKAYRLVDDIHKKQFFYIFIQYTKALLVTKKYDKLLKICEEAIQIYPDHMDIHFYYAHGLYELQMYNKSVEEFEKYLYLTSNYENLSIYNNLALVVNTLNSTENANYMLCKNNIKLNKVEEIKKYIYQVKDFELTKELVRPYVEELVVRGEFNELKCYYEHILKNNSVLLNGLIMIIENSLNKIKYLQRKRFYENFNFENDKYSKYCRIKSYKYSDLELSYEIKEEIQAFVNALDINNEIVIYVDIIYLVLKEQLNIFNITYKMNLNKQIEIIEYLRNKFDDLVEIIEKYDFQRNREAFNIDEFIYYKTYFIWKRTELLDLPNATDEVYIEKFNDYVNAGVRFVKFKYSHEFIENEYINDVANSEEFFFIYMIKVSKSENKIDKIRYYKKALEVYPGMNRGIKICLQNLNKEEENSEFDSYKKQIKEIIKNYLDNKEIDNAEKLIKEYEAIVKDDIEIVLFKSQITLIKAKIAENRNYNNN